MFFNTTTTGTFLFFLSRCQTMYSIPFIISLNKHLVVFLFLEKSRIFWIWKEMWAIRLVSSIVLSHFTVLYFIFNTKLPIYFILKRNLNHEHLSCLQSRAIKMYHRKIYPNMWKILVTTPSGSEVNSAENDGAGVGDWKPGVPAPRILEPTNPQPELCLARAEETKLRHTRFL